MNIYISKDQLSQIHNYRKKLADEIENQRNKNIVYKYYSIALVDVYPRVYVEDGIQLFVFIGDLILEKPIKTPDSIKFECKKCNHKSYQLEFWDNDHTEGFTSFTRVVYSRDGKKILQDMSHSE